MASSRLQRRLQRHKQVSVLFGQGEPTNVGRVGVNRPIVQAVWLPNRVRQEKNFNHGARRGVALRDSGLARLPNSGEAHGTGAREVGLEMPIARGRAGNFLQRAVRYVQRAVQGRGDVVEQGNVRDLVSPKSVSVARPTVRQVSRSVAQAQPVVGKNEHVDVQHTGGMVQASAEISSPAPSVTASNLTSSIEPTRQASQSAEISTPIYQSSPLVAPVSGSSVEIVPANSTARSAPINNLTSPITPVQRTAQSAEINTQADKQIRAKAKPLSPKVTPVQRSPIPQSAETATQTQPVTSNKTSNDPVFPVQSESIQESLPANPVVGQSVPIAGVQRQPQSAIQQTQSIATNFSPSAVTLSTPALHQPRLRPADVLPATVLRRRRLPEGDHAGVRGVDILSGRVQGNVATESQLPVMGEQISREVAPRKVQRAQRQERGRQSPVVEASVEKHDPGEVQNWQRLKQIMRLHDGKGQAAVEQPSFTEAEDVPQGSPVQNNIPVVDVPQNNVPIQRQAKPTATPSQAGPAPLPSKPQPATAEQHNWQRLEQIVQLHQGKRVETIKDQPTPAKIPTNIQPDPIEPVAEGLQATSLDTVWPVQRSSAENNPTPQVARRPISPPARRETSTDQHIRSLLNQVDGGRNTQSPIEFVTPRRPRPTVQRSQKLSKEDLDNGAATAESNGYLPQNSLSEAPTVVTKQGSQQDQPQPLGTATLATHVQQSAQATAAPPLVHRMVETDVGELPADLWRMIGEQPPVAKIATPTATLPAIGQAEALAPTTPAPALVQRLVAEPPTKSTPDLIKATPPEKSMSNDSAEAELDTDAIAKQVYAQLKRKLTVEWERQYRR